MHFDVFEPLVTLWGHLKAHLGLDVDPHGIYGLHGVYGAQGLYYRQTPNQLPYRRRGSSLDLLPV